MKVSQIVALSATLIFQTQACVRVRVDRYIHDTYGTIQSMNLYDNDLPVKSLPYPINFRTSDDENRLEFDGYKVVLQYKGDKRHPYGGRITYPEGADRDLQGKPGSTTHTDGDGWLHDVYCFSDNYDNCDAYTCGV